MKMHRLITLALLVCASASAVQLTDHKESKNRVITLEEAYDMTLASDQTIRIAFYEIRKANLLPWSALTRLGPQLIGNASYTGNHSSSHNDALVETSATPGFIKTAIDTQFSGFTYTQPIFDPTVFPAYRYGKLSAKAARLQYQFTVRETLFGVAQAYYNVLKQQKLVDVNQQTVDLASEQLITAQARFDAGAVARIDVLRARSTVEGARNTLIQSQGTLDTARDTLSNILNLGGKTNFTLAEPPVESDPGTPFEASLKNAYDCREDYKVSAIGVDQKVALRGEVIADYGPKVVAQATTQWSRTSGDNEGRNHNQAAAISVQMPFLTGGQREIDLITANQNISQSRLNLEKTAKSIESEVKVAWVSVQTGREALKALTAEVEAATQNYTDLQAQYQAGASTSLDAQTALRDLNNSRTLLTNQIYNYQIALRDLQRAEAAFQQPRVEKSKVQ
ncbi:MAG: TolC family protein [Verrucomicrobia bacterium]|nr:TolC family protein [Verrucomicrobiota bacterium]